MSERSIAAVQKAPVALSPARAGVLQRQCACGQHAIGGECEACGKKRSGWKARPEARLKLEVGAADDPSEVQADDLAKRVMRMASPGRATFDRGEAPVLRRKCQSCPRDEDDHGHERLVRKEVNRAVSHDGRVAPMIVHQTLHQSGRPLDSETRDFFEPRFGFDFSRVRVHTEGAAAESARAVGALAYTVGRDIVFNTGQYSPRSIHGRGLLAHELSHVMQNTQAPGGRPVVRRMEDPLSLRESFNPSAHTYEQLEDELAKIQGWLDSNPVDSPERASLVAVRAQIIATRQRLDKALGRTPLTGIVDTRQFSTSPEQKEETAKLNQLYASPPASAKAVPAQSQKEEGAAGLGLAAFWLKVPEAVKPTLVNSAIDLAIKGIDSVRGKGFPGPLWNVFIKPGLLGFLRKLKSSAEAVKIRVIDKIANIFSLKDDAFNWAFLKGLLKGFFIDGALGIFIAIRDLAKGLGSVWDFLKDVGKTYPEEVGAFLLKFGVRSQELVNGIGPAIDELKVKFLDPKESGSLSDMIVEKGKLYAGQAGEKLADELLMFFDGPQASAQVGEVVGDVLGIALWEVVFAALTAGAGILIKEGTGALAKFLRAVVEGVLKAVAKVQEFFGKITGAIKQAIGFVKGKLNELGGKLVELLEDAEKFFAKLLGKCVEHSPVSCNFKETQALLGEREIAAKAAKTAAEQAAAIDKVVEELLKVDKSRPGAMKEIAGKIHGLRDPAGQAIGVLEVKVDGNIRYAAATNSGAGWAGAQSQALKELGIERIPPFGKELVHAEGNVRAWVTKLKSEGKTVQVIRWGVSATKEGGYICGACRTIIEGLGGTIEEFSALGKN